MRTTIAVICATVIALCAATANAKEGFYIGFGMGYASASGEKVSAANNKGDGIQLQQFGTDGIQSAFALALRFGYNVMGYGSAELDLTPFGSSLGDKDHRNGTGLITGNLKFHPIEIWLHAYDVDPYVFFGLGYSFAAYQASEYYTDTHGNLQVKPEMQSKGFSGMAVQWGFGLDYYILRWFSVGALVNFYYPLYSTMYYDWNKGKDYALDPRPSTSYIMPMILATFHFVPGESDVPKAPPPAPAQGPATAAAPAPVYIPVPVAPAPPPKVDADTFVGRAKSGDLEGVKAALNSGTDVNAKNGQGVSALWAAAFDGKVEVIRVLLANGAGIDAAVAVPGPDEEPVEVTALHVAAANGHLPAVRVLKEAGADVNYAGSDGMTPLMVAAVGGHADMVKYLLDSGADAKRKNKKGQTAAELAKKKGNKEIVKLLNAKKAGAK